MEGYSDFEAIIKSKDFEGEILHMYQDSKGLVTVGVGNMLPTFKDAQKLPFVSRATQKPATKDEIKTDFEKVKNAPKGFVAEGYKKYTKLDLPSSDSSKLLGKRIEEFVSQLRHKYPGFDDLPRPAKLGLLDLAFNCGTAKLTTTFPNFNKAVQNENWNKAAIESFRPQILHKRNEVVKNWFTEAQKLKEKEKK